MTDIAFFVNDVPIRLTDESWRHIVENHDVMAGYLIQFFEQSRKPIIL